MDKSVVRLGAELYERDNKRFGKFFLISDARNLNRWQVTKSSIAKRLRTFIGRPFISEPQLKHFGAEDLSLDQVIQKQEEFKMGDIVDVVYDENTGIAAAIVEFNDTPEAKRVWEEINAGKAIYVSPAIAGTYSRQPDGTELYTDWFGLHLARVGDPAYGVFHASVKATCVGNERECVRNLIASASRYLLPDDSFNIAGFSSCKNMSQNDKAPIQNAAETQTEVAQLKQKLADFEKKLDAVSTAYEKLKGETSEPPMEGKDAREIRDPPSDGKQAQAAGIPQTPEVKALQNQLTEMAKEMASAKIANIIEMEVAAGNDG